MDWEGAAKLLAAEVGFSWIPAPVAEAMRLGSGPLHVACSGGADSVFALLATAALRVSGALGSQELLCLHFNHALRGDESDADEAFVRELAAGLGLRCLVGRANWDKPLEEVSEADARELRLGYFRDALRSEGAERPARIVTGHQGGDVPETLLMRLSRGSGVSGLAAPRLISRPGPEIVFLRPLLGLSKGWIVDALRRLGVGWREDASNQKDDFYRNRLRSTVVPAWEAAADRDLLGGILRSRRLLEEDADALDKVAQRTWKRLGGGSALDSGTLAEEPRAIQRRVVALLCSDAPAPQAALMERILDGIAGRETFDFELGQGIGIVHDVQRLRLRRQSPCGVDFASFRLPIGCVAYLPDGSSLSSRLLEGTAALAGLREGADDGRRVRVEWFPQQSRCVIVRQRQDGDAFRPLGKSSPKKLKDLFIERKISVEERRRLPVVLDGDGDIVWVPGLPPAVKRLLKPGTEHALQLTYQKGVSNLTRLDINA